jgi:ATP-dependent Clp protease ATP-binding subunit ClpA
MRISDDLRVSLSVAVSEAARRGHGMTGLEHALLALLLDERASRALHEAGADVDGLRIRLEGFLDEDFDAGLPADTELDEPSLTVGLRRALERAAVHGEGAGKEEISTTDLLVALFDEVDAFASFFLHESGATRLDLVRWLAHGVGVDGGRSRGREHAAERDAALEGADDHGDGASRRDPLATYARDLTALAAAGRIDPLIGRDDELQRAMHVLQRRRKNNPVFVGEPGVGKTAIVEGLALRIAQEAVPDALAGVSIWRLDLGALLAGTRYRGDFEERLKGVLGALEERADERPVLFIDEIHTLIGAGGASGATMDASNLLKPALEAGWLRCIGATTWEEFRQHFERDRALARRFQRIDVEEPSIEETVRILEGLRERYESHHELRYSRAAIRAAAELAGRYLQDRRLPDKAIDVLDEAGAAAALAGRSLVRAPDVERTLATMARIPPRRVVGDDRTRLAALEENLRGVVFGQDAAVTRVVAAIKVSRAGLREAQKPVGSFLFTGPTGVGKTELARALAEALGVAFLRFDMSEYMERHSVSRLVGAPPGYVGFDRGGLLTESVSQNPHAVLLLDEIEKAHPDVFNILLQVMDHGSLTDTNGKATDFRHVVLIMTSNVGARELAKGGLGFTGEDQGSDGRDEAAFERIFSPEFRNRLDARVPFAPLSKDVMQRIVGKFVDRLREQLSGRGVKVALSDEGCAALAELGYDPHYGARPLERVIAEQIKRPLTEELLFGRLASGGKVAIDADSSGIVLRYGDDSDTAGDAA